MTQKEIVLVNYSLTPGGAERYITELANYLVNNNYHVSILLLKKDKIFYNIDSRIAILEPEFKIGISKTAKYFYFIKVIFYIRKNIKIIRPSFIINTAFPFFFMISVLGIKIPVVITIRCNPNITGLIEGIHIPLLFRQIMYKKSKGIIAQTSFASKILSNQFRQTKIITIPNILITINSETFERENTIISAGYLKKSKGFDYLIKAFHNTNTANWKLIILGEGPERQNLQNLIETHGLNDKVLLPGNKKNIVEYFAKSKIFAFTSLSEGFPNVLLEAMATPLACISFDCDAGPRDLIYEGVNGFLIELENIEEFSFKLQLLMDDEKLREKFMSESIKVRDTYNKNKIGARYIELIEEFSK